MEKKALEAEFAHIYKINNKKITNNLTVVCTYVFFIGDKMARKKPVRLYKKKRTLGERINEKITVEMLLVIGIFIVFIIAIWFSVGETSWYNRPILY